MKIWNIFFCNKKTSERENELKWNQNDRQGHFIVKKNVHICLFESQIQIFQIFSIWSSSFNQLANIWLEYNMMMNTSTLRHFFFFVVVVVGNIETKKKQNNNYFLNDLEPIMKLLLLLLLFEWKSITFFHFDIWIFPSIYSKYTPLNFFFACCD